MNQVHPIISKLCYSQLMLAAMSSMAQSSSFTLTGNIIGSPDGYATLTYHNEKGEQVKDSSVLKDGHFYFKGKLSEPTLATLRGDVQTISDDDPNAVNFYLEPAHMTAAGRHNQLKELKITGSSAQQQYETLQNVWGRALKENTSAEDKQKKIDSVTYRFIASNPGSYVSAFQLSVFKSRWALDTVRILYSKLNAKVQDSYWGKETKRMIIDIESNSPGKPAKDFIATDMNGKTVRLSDFKGKWVLLDFWASWCIPCRESFPHLQELYSRYRNNGMAIIAISQDHDLDAWKQAIKKDNIGAWYNIAEMRKKRETPISDQFGIQSLPTKILIDKNGIIIGRYGGAGGEPTEALDKELAELNSNSSESKN